MNDELNSAKMKLAAWRSRDHCGGDKQPHIPQSTIQSSPGVVPHLE